MKLSCPVALLAILSICLMTRVDSAGGAELETAALMEDYERHAITHAGDVARGKVVFNDTKRAKCVNCHMADGAGEKIGPDLSRIGGKFDRIHLVESILEPSKQLVEGYRTSQVLTHEGQVLTGIIKEPGETSFVLEDADAKRQTILRSDVDSIQASAVSIMPTGLADQLSRDEFTDLIAYLESQRTGMQTGFGAATKGPLQVAEGFGFETIATGITGAVGMEILDDGRILICEQTGTLRVIKDGKLLPEPMLTLDVEHYWERGLIGVTSHPDFDQQPWIYVTYVVAEPFTHHVISRFRVNGDIADPASEQIFLEGDDQSKLGGFKPSGHQGGGMHFGGDGHLYVGLGEQTAELPAQKLDTLQGKILRFTDTGAIPRDNPFYEQAQGKYRAIWAIGCRNPFSFAFDDQTGLMLINDVGGKVEEINVGKAGANYGWPIANHGPSDNPDFTGPIHFYPEASISGGDFAPPGSHASLEGRYAFGDFVHGWIHTIDPTHPKTSQPLVTGLRRPVDVRFASDGSLYVLLRNAWIMDDKFQADTGSVLRFFRER